LLAETFGVVGDMNRHMEHGFRRCGALREGIHAHVTLVADASNACDLDAVRAAARDLSNETRRFEAAWTELYKNYRRGRREIDQHAAKIEMESGMSLDD
jgi:hypothetical protein